MPDRAEYHSDVFSRAGTLYIEGLLEGLAAHGFRVTEAVSFFPTAAVPRGRRWWFGRHTDTLSSGVRVVLVRFLNVTPLKQLAIGIGTAWEIVKWGWRERRARQRLVYCYNLMVPPAPFVLAAARMARAHAVASLNDIPEPGQTVPDTWMWRVNLGLHRWLVPRFDGLVVVADAIARDFAPGRPYVRVEGGIPTRMAGDAAASRPARRDGEPFTVVFAGHLTEVNGIRQLLESFRLLEGQCWRLRIAGSGPLEGAVREAAAIDGRIDFAGFVGFSEVLSLYRSGDVLVDMRITRAIRSGYFFPSKLMEYLASGTPVISTCTGHAAAEFDTYIYRLPEETPDALAEKIREVAATGRDEREALGRRAMRFVMEQKSWDAQGARIAKYLEEVVLARRSAGGDQGSAGAPSR